MVPPHYPVRPGLPQALCSLGQPPTHLPISPPPNPSLQVQKRSFHPASSERRVGREGGTD